MLRKPIVVGVDESPETGHAVRVAQDLATATGAPSRFIHVIPDMWVTPDLAAAPITPGMIDEVVDDTRRRLRNWMANGSPHASAAAVEVVVGRAERVLADAAAGAQLIVVGGKSHGALARGLGASTAHYLVRSADVPVLIVALPWPVRRVLAAVDLSYAAAPTIDAARQLAAALHAQLRLLHVVEPVHPLLGNRVNEEIRNRNERHQFDQLTAGVPGVEADDRVMRRGPVADAIAEEAAQWRADVIVVGSHGKGWIERMLVGSATERLMALLPASLLVVPTRPVEKPPAWPELERHVAKGMVVI